MRRGLLSCGEGREPSPRGFPEVFLLPPRLLTYHDRWLGGLPYARRRTFVRQVAILAVTREVAFCRNARAQLMASFRESPMPEAKFPRVSYTGTF